MTVAPAIMITPPAAASVEQVLVAEGFGEALYRPGLHRLHAHRDIAVAGDEKNGEGQIARRQLLLQLQPAEAWQPPIEHQTAGSLRGQAAQAATRSPTDSRRS